MIWLARLCMQVDPKEQLVIEADRWFDARAWAIRKLGEEVQVRPSRNPKLSGKPDVQLEWRGTDFRETGGRALWMRERGQRKWTRT